MRTTRAAAHLTMACARRVAQRRGGHLIALAAPIHLNRLSRRPPQRRIVHDVCAHGARNVRKAGHDGDPRARNVNVVAGVEDLNVVDKLRGSIGSSPSRPTTVVLAGDTIRRRGSTSRFRLD